MNKMREKIKEVLKEEQALLRKHQNSKAFNSFSDYDRGVSNGWVEALEYVLGLMT